MSAKIRVLSIFGTRPEAVKMAPIVETIQADAAFTSRIAVTGQHREMLDQVLDHFRLQPDYDLRLMQAGQSLSDLAGRIVQGLEPIMRAERPDVVLVHGDTSTCFAAALAAFYNQIPVGHVEAGLRTGVRYDPFPEEMHRRLTTSLATLHFAPTERARQNLLAEGVPASHVTVTGNTVIDALLRTVRPDYTFSDPALREIGSSGRKLLLVTAHRRENVGQPLDHICMALRRLVDERNDIELLFSMHRNPHVRRQVQTHLSGCDRVHLIDPPGYADFANLLQRAHLVLTDSGGLQEEAPALGKPVLVLRETTERPEGVEAGVCSLVGTHPTSIVSAVFRLLSDQGAYDSMARAVSPFGDGQASRRIISFIRDYLAQGQTSYLLPPKRCK